MLWKGRTDWKKNHSILHKNTAFIFAMLREGLCKKTTSRAEMLNYWSMHLHHIKLEVVFCDLLLIAHVLFLFCFFFQINLEGPRTTHSASETSKKKLIHNWLFFLSFSFCNCRPGREGRERIISPLYFWTILNYFTFWNYRPGRGGRERICAPRSLDYLPYLSLNWILFPSVECN